MKRRDFLKTSLLAAGAVFVSPALLSSRKTYRGEFVIEEDDHWRRREVQLVVYDGGERLYCKVATVKWDGTLKDINHAKLLLKTWQKEYAPEMKIIYED